MLSEGFFQSWFDDWLIADGLWRIKNSVSPDPGVEFLSIDCTKML